MKEKTYPIKDHLVKGLVLANNKRNNPMLTDAVGAYPFDDALKAIDQMTQIDTSSLGALTFPFPQFFKLSDVQLVCTPTAIYEYDGALHLKISGLTSCSTWEVLDFKVFLYLTNGAVAVIKDAFTGAYSVSSSLPYALTCCNYNGQAIIGSPNTTGFTL